MLYLPAQPSDEPLPPGNCGPTLPCITDRPNCCSPVPLEPPSKRSLQSATRRSTRYFWFSWLSPFQASIERLSTANPKPARVLLIENRFLRSRESTSITRFHGCPAIKVGGKIGSDLN